MKHITHLLAVIVLTGASIACGEDLPSLSKTHFADPSKDQVERLVQRIQNLEALSFETDRWLADCSGTISYSTTQKNNNRLRVVEFRFIFAEDYTKEKQRYLCSQSTVLDEVEQTEQSLPGGSPSDMGLIKSNGLFLDLLVQREDGKVSAVYSRGGPAKPLSDQSSPTDVLYRCIIFHPIGASLSSIMELRQPSSLKPNFGRFRGKLINGFGVTDGLEVGRWFYENRGLASSQFPKELGLIRYVAFDRGRPVVIEDRFGKPTPTEKGRSSLYCRTEVEWKDFHGKSYPVRIRAYSPGFSRSDIELTISWRFGDQVPEGFLDPNSIGKTGFDFADVDRQ